MKIRAFDERSKKMYSSYAVLGWNGSIQVLENDIPHSKIIDIGTGCDVYDDYDGQVIIMYGFNLYETIDENGYIVNPGISIYEGDVIENYAMRDIVVFEHGCFVGKNSQHDQFGYRQPICVHNELRVIGNVYEHPHLLDN